MNPAVESARDKSAGRIGYDGLSRLVDVKRGNLNGNKDAIATGGDRVRGQAWGLDALGNWATYLAKNYTGGRHPHPLPLSLRRKGEYCGDLDHDRTHSPANEIETITGGANAPASGRPGLAGRGWSGPEPDACGNMVVGPRGDDPTVKLHFSYDAWNRLAEVCADNAGAAGSTIAEYQRDGLNRRVAKLRPWLRLAMTASAVRELTFLAPMGPCRCSASTAARVPTGWPAGGPAPPGEIASSAPTAGPSNSAPSTAATSPPATASSWRPPAAAASARPRRSIRGTSSPSTLKL